MTVEFIKLAIVKAYDEVSWIYINLADIKVFEPDTRAIILDYSGRTAKGETLTEESATMLENVLRAHPAILSGAVL